MGAPLSEDPALTIAVSLKMYLDVDETDGWIDAVGELAGRRAELQRGRVELIVLPSLPTVGRAVERLEGLPVRVGAQDLHSVDSGPVTGGVSGRDLRRLGCDVAEINHVERRRVFHEDEAVAVAKLGAALRNDLTPLICVGEPAPVPVAEAAALCGDQLDRLLDSLAGDVDRILVAYEPEWAIGSREPASAEHVRTVSSVVRDRLDGHPLVRRSSVIYGGSAGPGLLTELAGAVDGLFLGRFAHDPRALEAVLDECVALIGAEAPDEQTRGAQRLDPRRSA